MKTCISIVCLLFAAACTEFDVHPEYRVETPLRPYADQFFKEAAARGVHLKKENLVVILRDRLINEEGTFGLSFKEGSQRVVFIDRDYFNTYENSEYPERIEFMVFHEFGHAILGLPHIDLPNSIMSAKECALCGQYLKNRDELLNELFHQAS